MNINATSATTRLDDRFNAFLITAAIGAVFSFNIGTLQGAALGRDGMVAQSMVKALVKAPAAAPVVARVAAR